MRESIFDMELFKRGTSIKFECIRAVDLNLMLPALLEALVDTDASISITKCPASVETEQGNP